MPIKKNRLTYCPSSTTVSAVVILLALGFTLPCTPAPGPWVEVQPPFVEEGELDVGIIHFIDAETGWALAPDSILRTADGGHNWHRHERPDDLPRWTKDFSSPTTGWSLTEWRHQNSPMLLEDIEFIQTTDGGLTWQPKRGKVTELVLIGDETPHPDRPLADNVRLKQVGIYFFDDQFGWIVGPTDHWAWRRDWLGEPRWKLLAGNFLCSTRDGGATWKCQIHIYVTRVNFRNVIDKTFRMPERVYFHNPQVGWIAPSTGWMYHTKNGGANWEVVGHPYAEVMPKLPRELFLDKLIFVDESRGWAGTTESAWFTTDGGRTWRIKFRGLSGVLYANKDGVWLPGYEWSPNGELINGIFHSADDGDTWELEWEGPQRIYVIVYNEVTQSLWAGGEGIILQKNLQTAVAPKGKLTTLWGKLKADSNSNK